MTSGASLPILVIGALNIDQVITASHEPEDDGSVLVETYHRGFGGHAGNCATALARIGANVAVIATVGDDIDGSALIDDLESEGVGTHLIERIPRVPTGQVVIPTFTGRRYMLQARGANSDLRVVPRRTIAEAGVVVVFDPPKAVVEGALRAASDAGRRSIWAPGGLYPGDRWLVAAAPSAQHLVMNREEYQRARSTGAGDVRADQVTVTRGEDGAETWGNRGSFRVAAVETDVIDATGAGDAFVGGLALGESLEIDLPVALQIAATMGALATRGVGARVGLPTAIELEEALPVKSPARHALAERWGRVGGRAD